MKNVIICVVYVDDTIFSGENLLKKGPDKFHLTQPGIQENVLQAGCMSNANEVNTPTIGDPVGADFEGTALDKEMEYWSIVGMLMYLAANTCPDIAYAVHQVAGLSNRAYFCII